VSAEGVGEPEEPDHVEHASERIEEGRGERRGGAMSADDFRAAVGAIEGNEVIFGPERFDFGEMRAAIHRATEAVGGTLETGLRVSFPATLLSYSVVAIGRRAGQERRDSSPPPSTALTRPLH
jgi:hypothetical protein